MRHRSPILPLRVAVLLAWTAVVAAVHAPLCLAGDQADIGVLLRALFDKPEARLMVEPVVVADAYASSRARDVERLRHSGRRERQGRGYNQRK